MTIEEFQRILKRAEVETLDFKREGYNLESKPKRYEFVKDILAMANTPREGDAYIVIGVNWTPEDGATVVGLDRQYDDIEFQDKFGMDMVQPRPRFTYVPFEHEGKKVGIFQVPVGDEGPYTPTKDLGGTYLQAGTVYYRSGTGNERAIGTELRRIYDWFISRNNTPRIVEANNSWNPFIESVHRFSSSRAFVLVTDRFSAETAPIQALGKAPWRAVIDFDPDSERAGLLKGVLASIEKYRVIHRTVKGEYIIHPEPGTHWFFARGLSGRQDTLCLDSHKEWLKAYKPELGKQLERLTSAISPTPVTVVVIWSDRDLRAYLRTMLEELHGAFGDLAEIVVVSEDAASFDEVCKEADVPLIQMSMRSLCAGIDVHFSEIQEPSTELCILPTSAGGPIKIDQNDKLWFSEDLEPAYRGIGVSGDDSSEAFRKGGQISWRNLQLRHDCDRDITSLLRTKIQAELQSRGTIRINLYHAPGAGGTTVGHRVVWDLHEMWPSAILHRCAPQVTAARITKIYSLTEKSVLVLVDGREHSERDIDDLYEFLKASQTPTVLLQILRRFKPQQPGRREFWLGAELSHGEADRFRDVYSKAVPEKASEMTKLTGMNFPERTAFFFGLTAYGRDFRGLGPYVETRISGLTESQRKILVYIALAHYYGQQSVPAQAFDQLLGLPHSRNVDIQSAFRGYETAMELLTEVKKGEWRTIHHLIALEVLQQALSPAGSLEKSKVWRQNLSAWAKDFATFCCGADHTKSDRLLELIRRMFIYRDNTELLGTERAIQTQFAQLIEEIPSRHGKVEVLRHLTEKFPFEAHFHAHLGRFLGLNGEFKDALESVDFAISQLPNDPVLHHVRGMILRYTIKDKISKRAPIKEIIDLAKNAAESFQTSQELSPDQEHGYISEVQMLVDVLDYSGSSSSMRVQDIISRAESDPFLRYAISRAEELLDRVQHLYVSEQPSRYVIDCRARLHRLYEDYSRALQDWGNLLARPEVSKPPVRRQIVWTILRRHEGSWEKLSDKEIERVTSLLDENLEEEVTDSTSLRLWIRAIRHSKHPPSLDAIIERVAYWKTNTGSLDAVYYLYVMHALRALEGSVQSLGDSERALEECKAIARFRRDRTRSFEWIGPGHGIQRLVHQSLLGEWKDEVDFWEKTALLTRIVGRITTMGGPQKGIIELTGGVNSFFVPARGNFSAGHDENLLVTCYLGFSYDGPIAWDVKRMEK